MATLRLPIFVLLCACASQAWPRASSPERHVVYPLRADAAGHVISADVTSHYHGGAGEGGREGGEGGGRRSGRVKRDSANGTSEGDPRENLYIVINNENEELFLNLTPNTKLVTQHTVIEWVLEDGRRILRKATGDCFYVGRLRSTEKSLVAISNCNGLTGYIQTHNDSYFIEPLRNQGGGRGGGEGAEDGGGGGGGGADHPQPHLIYKVKSITSRLNLSLQQDQEFRQHEGDEDEDEEEEEEEEDDEEEEEEDEEELAEEERRTPGEKGGLRQTQGKRRGETGGERDFWKGTTLEMPKFRRHHHHRHREQRPVVEEEATFPEEEPTFPEFLDSLARIRRRRSSVFGASLSQDLETMRSTLQRAKSLKKAFIPKFRRRPEEVDRVTTRPKFVRPRSEVREPASSSSSYPSTSDRIGRSTPTRPPKFDQRYRPTFHDSDRAKREDNEGGRETERRENETEEEEGRENEEAEGDGEERRDRKRRKKDRKKKKNRKRCKVQESESGSENQTNETETDETSNKEGRCRERKKLTKEERQRRKEERRERRRLEREKKLREKEKKKKERRERRRKKNRKMMNDSMTATFPQAHTNVGDPFDGEDWQGYSPDVFWETPVAEGSSGLAEVSLGPALNTTDPPKWLELVVAVDHTVIEFHGEDEVEKYVFTLFNIVSAIYEDPSLESSLELVMLRIIFYKDKKHSQGDPSPVFNTLTAIRHFGNSPVAP